MSELIRCCACRGSKMVAKLGGILGECNTCNGSGKIKAVDKPKPVPVVELDESVADIIDAVEGVSMCGGEAVFKPKPKAVVSNGIKRAVFTKKKG